MVRTQIQLTHEQARALRERAEREGVSMAKLVRDAVDGLLERKGAVDPWEWRQRAAAAAGRFRSGRGELSVDHDRYFSERVDDSDHP